MDADANAGSPKEGGEGGTSSALTTAGRREPSEGAPLSCSDDASSGHSRVRHGGCAVGDRKRGRERETLLEPKKDSGKGFRATVWERGEKEGRNCLFLEGGCWTISSAKGHFG